MTDNPTYLGTDGVLYEIKQAFEARWFKILHTEHGDHIALEFERSDGATFLVSIPSSHHQKLLDLVEKEVALCAELAKRPKNVQ